MTLGRPRTRPRRHCATCGKELSRATRGTYCRAHYTQDAEVNARRAESIRRTWAINPHLLAARSKAIAEANRRPERRERSAQLARDSHLWERGLPAMNTPEARRKQGTAQSRARLAHIPLERLDEYRVLVRKVGAAEAERLVMEHQAVVLARGHR